jgi:hypothetical protein
MKWLFGIALMFALFGVPATAQVDGEDLNACFAGGSMEGKCALDADGDGVLEDFETDWAWECGWYIGQLDAGLISFAQVPERCISVVPDSFRCFTFVPPYPGHSIQPHSIRYIGPPNVLNNTQVYRTLDCSGVGVTPTVRGIIIADDWQDAYDICASLGPKPVNLLMTEAGYPTAPQNYYICEQISVK